MTERGVDMTDTTREEPLRIWWNKNLHGKITPMKLAAHAAHAALAAYGIKYTHPIVVLAAGKAKIEAMPITIHDAGYTELEPGTLTTGVEKEWRPAGGDAQIQRLREAIAAQTGIYPTIEAAEVILRAVVTAGEGAP